MQEEEECKTFTTLILIIYPGPRAPHLYKIFSDSRSRGHTVLEALGCRVFPSAWQKNKAISLFLQNLLSPYFRSSLVHREAEISATKYGAVRDLLAGRQPRRAPRLDRKLGISLHTSLLWESGGLEDFSEARSPGTPCRRAVPHHTRPAYSEAAADGEEADLAAAEAPFALRTPSLLLPAPAWTSTLRKH